MDIKQFHRLINYIINNNKILYSTRFTFLPFQIGEREREKVKEQIRYNYFLELINPSFHNSNRR